METAILDLSSTAPSPRQVDPIDRHSPEQSGSPIESMQKMTFEVSMRENSNRIPSKSPEGNDERAESTIKINPNGQMDPPFAMEDERKRESHEEIDVGSPLQNPVDLSLAQRQEQELDPKSSMANSSSVSGLPLGGVPVSGAGGGGDFLIPFLMAAASSQRAVLAAAVAAATSSPGSSKKFKCEKCNAAFSSTTTLEAHSKSYCPGNADKTPVRQLNGSSSNQHKLIPKSRESSIHSAVVSALSKAHSPSITQSSATSTSESGTTLVKKHECDACGIRFMHFDTLKTHQEVYCKFKRERASSLSPNDCDTGPGPTIKEENLPKLPLSVGRINRKRRSPSLDQDMSLKPFAKHPCNNCQIKFNCESNLIAHQKFYCFAKNETSSSVESVKRELLTSPSGSLNLNGRPDETEPPNSEGETSSLGQTNVLCKLCDGPVVRMFLRHHLYAFHRIVHKDLINDLITKYCSNTYQDQAPSTPPLTVKSESFVASREVTVPNSSSRSVSPLSNSEPTTQVDNI